MSSSLLVLVGHQGRVLKRAHPDLNQGPSDLHSAALATELPNCMHEILESRVRICLLYFSVSCFI